MSTQQNPLVYAQAFQAQLQSVCGSTPVYAEFNRNWATEPNFVAWHLRNVHQPVYTGPNQANKGIDRPIFQISIFAQTLQDAFGIANTILQAMHGYTGEYGGLLYVAKTDISWLYNTYDDTTKLQQVILDCQLDIPT
jgi:glycine cleavage system protein P-like pyridoxal-binding family